MTDKVDKKQIVLTDDEITDYELGMDLKEIFEGSFDGILVTDADGKILYVNRSYERVAEIRREEMKGKYMKDLINPVWMPNSVVYLVAEQKKPVSKRQLVKSGRHIMVTGTPVLDAEGEIKRIVVNARDITEIYQLTEDLQRSKEMAHMYAEKYSQFAGSNPEGSRGPGLLATSSSMKNVLSLADRVSNFQATVLITGESGVGKEEVARYIHYNGVRKDKPFIPLNCGAVPSNLLESELFGYEKGAFTGADAAGKDGIMLSADGGTVFLDEIGETPLDFQVKLLRFLESKEVRKVGSSSSQIADVRILAATNRNLEDMVKEGTFREDLYYRLNVVQIDVPPLRKRKKDILPLASMFLHRFNQAYGQEKLFTPDVIAEFERYPWTGNVRELRNVVENMVIVSNNEYLQTEDIPWVAKEGGNQVGKMVDGVVQAEGLNMQEAMEALERAIYQKAKEQCRTTREIAELVDVNQSTVVRKLKKYNL